MKLKIFTVYDSKAEAYLQPFFMKTKGEAIRAILNTINDSSSKSNMSMYPEDFTLMEIGEWDEATGSISTFDHKNSLGNLIEWRKPEIVHLGQQA